MAFDLTGKKSQLVIDCINHLIDNGIVKSKAEIARSLDVKPQYLNRIVTGERNVSDAFFKKFTTVYDVSQYGLHKLLKDSDKNLPLVEEDQVIYQSIYREKDPKAADYKQLYMESSNNYNKLVAMYNDLAKAYNNLANSITIGKLDK